VACRSLSLPTTTTNTSLSAKTTSIPLPEQHDLNHCIQTLTCFHAPFTLSASPPYSPSPPLPSTTKKRIRLRPFRPCRARRRRRLRPGPSRWKISGLIRTRPPLWCKQNTQTHRTHQQPRAPSVNPSFFERCFDDATFSFSGKYAVNRYVDLVANPERFTGYSGVSPHRIWQVGTATFERMRRKIGRGNILVVSSMVHNFVMTAMVKAQGYVNKRVH
jgi:hypothetical protein